MGAPVADTVLHGGRIYSMRSEGEHCDAIAMRDGVVLATGSLAELRDLIGADTVVEDLGGNTVVPGFIDAHVHIEPEFVWRFDRPGRAGSGADVSTAQADLLQEIAGAVAASNEEWVLASVSPDQVLTDELLPRRRDLDRIGDGRALVVSVGGRHFLLNSRALELGGFLLPPTIPVPPDGSVETDADGAPDGVVRGRAIEVVMARSPFGTLEMAQHYLAAGVARMIPCGVTSIHHITRTVNAVRGWQALARQDRLPVRVGLLIRAFNAETQLADITGVGLLPGFGDSWLSFLGVKISIDGAIPERGAALVDDYDDAPGWRGSLRVVQQELTDFVVEAHRAGIRCAVHTKGDRAIGMALEAFGRAQEVRPDPQMRHRLEHAGNLRCSPASIERMKRLGLCAVLNPPFLDKDAGLLRGRVGSERGRAPLNARDFLDAGVPLAAASDVNTRAGAAFDPLSGMANLVTRRNWRGELFDAEQAISVWEAMQCYTTRAAWLGFEESWKGMLRPGYVADLAVLSADPFESPPDGLRDIQVVQTLVGGQVRHNRVAEPTLA